MVLGEIGVGWVTDSGNANEKNKLNRFKERENGCILIVYTETDKLESIFYLFLI